MATNINFRGEVNEMSAAYFCREIDALSPRSSATVYLHTPGGDIYAGGEMINALRSARKRGCSISLEIGSLCASMGAALLAAARADGCKAVAHSNSEVMFHGCWSIVLGGADELTDQAKAMRDFNEVVKHDLAKCGITDADEWFAADRQKWLNAEELFEMGLVDSVIENESADAEDLKMAAVKIAAKLNHKETPKMDEVKTEEVVNETVETPVEVTPAVETPAETVEEPKAEEVAPVEAEAQPTEEAKTEEAQPEAVAAPAVEDIEAKVADMANKRFAGLQAKHDKMICDLTKERDAAIADLTATKAVVTSLQGDIEKLEADLAACRDQLTKSEQNRESIVVNALAADTETFEGNAREILASLPLSKRAEFYKAHKAEIDGNK